jgi:hypothetical protein
MKNLFGNKSQATEMLMNRQSANSNTAMMIKYSSAKHDLAKYNTAEYDEQPVEIDEMQIDKLYQSL